MTVLLASLGVSAHAGTHVDEHLAPSAVDHGQSSFHLLVDWEGDVSLGPCRFAVEPLTAKAYADALIAACAGGYEVVERAGHAMIRPIPTPTTTPLLEMMVELPAGPRRLDALGDEIEAQLAGRAQPFLAGVFAPNGGDEIQVDVPGGRQSLRDLLLALEVVGPDAGDHRRRVAWILRVSDRATPVLPGHDAWQSLLLHVVDVAAAPHTNAERLAGLRQILSTLRATADVDPSTILPLEREIARVEALAHADASTP